METEPENIFERILDFIEEKYDLIHNRLNPKIWIPIVIAIAILCAGSVYLIISNKSKSQNVADNKTTQVNKTTQKLSQPLSQAGTCGDGTCDDVERNTGKCPSDCEASNTTTPIEKVDTSNTPTTVKTTQTTNTSSSNNSSKKSSSDNNDKSIVDKAVDAVKNIIDDIVSTCSDGVQNQDETGIDCGGTCKACATTDVCGDGTCGTTETYFTCLADCKASAEDLMSWVYSVGGGIDKNLPKAYVYLAVNINDYIHHNESAEYVSKIIDIANKNDIGLDLYFTEPVLKSYVKYHSDLIQKIKDSPKVTINYHVRLPHPCDEHIAKLPDENGVCKKFDELNYDYVIKTLNEFESHALVVDDYDFISNKYCPHYDPSELGGYEYVKNIFGAPPLFAGSNLGGTVRKAFLEVLSAKGLKGYVAYHEGETKKDKPFVESQGGLLERPSDFGIKYSDYSSNPYQEYSLELANMTKLNYGRPLFSNILIHDYEFYHRGVWYEKNILLADGSKSSNWEKTQDEQNAFLQNYEELINSLVNNKDVKVINGKDVIAMNDRYKEIAQSSNTETTTLTCTSWTYSDWGTCQPDNAQTRIVSTSSPSGCTGGSPILSQACTYVAPTCSDGIQNQDETGVDCGGSCASCVVCGDGTCSGSETNVNCATDCKDATSTSSSKTKIYVTFVSHNERSPHESGCDSLNQDNNYYLENRKLLIEFAKGIVENNFAWDFQTDWEWLDRTKKWESEDLKKDSDGKDIVSYLVGLSPENIVIDAHAHENIGTVKYNYADLVHIMDSYGIPRTDVVGGAIAFPAEQEAWTKFRNSLKGVIYPDFEWTPKILWGAATSQHKEDIASSGIWRPKDASHFFEDEPANNLIYVSQTGTDDSLQLFDELIQKLDKGELEDGKMYTATIFLSQCTMTEDEIEKSLMQVKQYDSYVKDGRLVWATIPEMVKTWKDEYSSTPNIEAFSYGEDQITTNSNSGSDLKKLCGDGTCKLPETSTNCPADCGTSASPATTTATSTTGMISKFVNRAVEFVGRKCGDGVCDDREKSDPTLCPTDCGSTTTPTTSTSTTNSTPTSTTSTTSIAGKISQFAGNILERFGAKCGDGVCGPIEKEKGICAKDCSASSTSTTTSTTTSTKSTPSVSATNQGGCGDGICGFVEKTKGTCPQDCK